MYCLQKCLLYITILILVKNGFSQNSPCPNMFQYYRDGYRTIGLVRLTSFQSSPVKLTVKLSIGVSLSGTYVGQIQPTSTNLDNELQTTGGIVFKVYFPVDNPLPLLMTLSVNDVVLCSGSSAVSSYVTTVSLDYNFYLNQNSLSGIPQSNLQNVFQQNKKPKQGNRNRQQYQNQNLNQNLNLNGNYQQNQQNFNQQSSVQNGYQNTQVQSSLENEYEDETDQEDNDYSQQQNNFQNTQQSTYRPVSSQKGNGKKKNNLQIQNSQQSAYRPTNGNGKKKNSQRNKFQQNTHGHGYQDDVPNGSNYKQKINDICGKTGKVTGLVVNGTKTIRGEYPWHAGIFKKKESGSIHFVCGGSLITNQHILTAAHCLNNGLVTKKEISKFLVMLGKYELNKYNEKGSVIMDVIRILIHSEYVSPNPDSDLGIMKLEEPVEFTNFIYPICLYPPSMPRDIDGQIGTVVGWGRNEDGEAVTNDLNEVKMVVVNRDTCRNFHLTYKNAVTETTFCAEGEKAGSSPCNGDSGGGMAMRVNDRWYLRGVVSVTRAVNASYIFCNPDEYAIFVDTRRLYHWIEDKVFFEK